MNLSDLPNDILKYYIFKPAINQWDNKGDVYSTLMVLRFVCRKFRDMIPLIRPHIRWDRCGRKCSVRIVTGIQHAFASHNRLNLLKWAYANKASLYTVYNEAAQRGHKEIIIWLKEMKFQCPMLPFSAGVYGDIEFLQWTSNITGHLTGADEGAAAGGHLKLLEWLLANNCPRGIRVIQRAANNGHLEIMKWARANGYSWSAEDCELATIRGKKEIIEWFLTTDCPYTSEIPYLAARYDQLEILQLYINSGRCWKNVMCYHAARYSNHNHIMKWIYSINPTGITPTHTD